MLPGPLKSVTRQFIVFKEVPKMFEWHSERFQEHLKGFQRHFKGFQGSFVGVLKLLKVSIILWRF